MNDQAAPPREVFGSRKGTKTVSWFHRNPALSNQHCLYCGRLVGAGASLESDKEHLIARNMGPPGGFADPDAFNFHFRAYRDCNNEKAGLEDHVAAITLLTSPGRQEQAVDAAARRKAANSFDPRHKGTPVGEVTNKMTMKMDGMFTFEMVSAAQLDRNKVKLLASRQIRGLFSLLTSKNPRETATPSLLSGQHFGFHGYYPYRDWGNPQLVEIARRAVEVPELGWLTTANGYFRAVLRREDLPGSPWFWALEWNKNLRLVGWIGDPDDPPQILTDLPDPGWHTPHH